jgi:hypothetical protein
MLLYIQGLHAYCKLGPVGFSSLVEKYRDCNKESCGGHRIMWGSYQRSVLTDHGPETIGVQRLLCKKCGKTISLLPPFVRRFGRWCLDEMIQTSLTIATQGISVFQGWRDVLIAPMDLKTGYRLLAELRSLAEKAQDRVQSWLSYQEPDFQVGRVSQRELVLPGRWYTLGHTIIMIKAFNDFRRIHGFQPVSVMGLIHYLSDHCWTSLLHDSS